LPIRTMAIAFLLLAILLSPLLGCRPKPTPLPEPDTPGGKLYRARCSVCHSLPHPKRMRYAQWEHMLSVMDKRMEHRKMKPLSEEERRAILEYLKRNAR